MNEEEKKAVEFIRDLITWDVRQYLCPNKKGCKNLETILNLIEKLQKENNRLRYENCRLKTIRYATDFGTESIHLIPESSLVEINTNRYMIEIEAGKFVDLKQVYQENEELKSKNKRINEKIKELNNKINKVKEYCNETIDFKDSFNERYDDCYDILKILEE